VEFHLMGASSHNSFLHSIFENFMHFVNLISLCGEDLTNMTTFLILVIDCATLLSHHSQLSLVYEYNTSYGKIPHPLLMHPYSSFFFINM